MDYSQYIDACLSEETLDAEESRECWPTKVPGKPRLKRFVGHRDEILNPQYIGDGEQGVVFRFNYCKKDLCLKLFKQWTYVGVALEDSEKILFSPFASECRAFGRLCDAYKNGTWAVRCHGWMYLSDNQLTTLQAADPDRHSIERYTRWAIVKDFIPEQLCEKDIATICAKKEIAKRAYLLPRDFRSRNYRGTYSVDLGSTMTIPYPGCDRPKFEFRKFYQYFPECVKQSDWWR